MSLALPEFVTRWKASSLSERSGAQQHFCDLCDVLGQPHPAAVDQSGESFTFEKHVSTVEGDKGFADVWKKGYFAWEYKGKHHDLHTAYLQLLRYREDLENPPLLVVCDQDRFEVHTNWPNTRKQIYSFTLSDLLRNEATPNCALPPLDVLRALFEHPEELRPDAPSVRVTEKAAAKFAELADNLNVRRIDPEKSAHFLMRLLFCLFADSIGLLPDHLFRKMIEIDRGNAPNFNRKLRRLFAAMAKGDNFGVYDVPYFNGGLFGDDSIIELAAADLAIVTASASLDWSRVEPAIFGTLFERSFDPTKRSQLGAHYTSKEDILTIIEPVLVAPLRKRWEEVKTEATALADAAEKEPKAPARNKLRNRLQETVFGWVEELSKVRVLDPACGSGNFLYLALKRMLDLWKEAYVFAAQHGLPAIVSHQVSPLQLYGIEKNVYAHELASVVVWIGYLQWRKDNGMGEPKQPILEPLSNIQHRDAILEFDSEGNPVEPVWPEAEYIIGNPPFLGGNKIRQELGDEYVDKLFKLYGGKLSAFADYVCYWFLKAVQVLEEKRTQRVGLLATQAIRGGVNRSVLERVKQSGDIFMAWSDRDWILDGAVVHVSMVGFDDGSEKHKMLDGHAVAQVNADLTSSVDVTIAARLKENAGLWAYGSQQKGSFDITPDTARDLLDAASPFGENYCDVVRPSVNAKQVMQRTPHTWVIDFGEESSAEKASLYEAPFEYLKKTVYVERKNRREKRQRDFWWLHARPSPKYRRMLRNLKRYIATPAVSKYRVYLWLDNKVLIDHAMIAFGRQDDYFLGVLQSRAHDLWARRASTQLREAESGTRYTPRSAFETFAFPWPPGGEPTDDPRVKAIAEAAKELVEKRDAWLNPPGTTELECKGRTMTNLYNKRPSWLGDAHRKLDEAVFAAYGWPLTLSDAEILQRLLALNHERAGRAAKSVAG